MLILVFFSYGLCFTQQSSNFISHAMIHSSKCSPKVKSITLCSAYQDKSIKHTKLRKHKIRKNKQKNAFETNMKYSKHLDDTEDENDVYVMAEKYYTYLLNVIEYYTFKFMKIYKAYRNNSQKMEKLEDFSTLLNNSLKNENMLFIRNRKYEYIITRLNALIEGFEILSACIANCTYDELSYDQLQELQDGYLNTINKYV